MNQNVLYRPEKLDGRV